MLRDRRVDTAQKEPVPGRLLPYVRRWGIRCFKSKRADALYGFSLCDAVYGQEGRDHGSNYGYPQHNKPGEGAEYKDGCAQNARHFSVEYRAENKACCHSECKADDRDDRRFGIENFEYVRTARTDGPQNADFFFLIRNRNGDKVEKQQHREYRHHHADPKEYLFESSEHRIYVPELIGNGGIQSIEGPVRFVYGIFLGDNRAQCRAIGERNDDVIINRVFAPFVLRLFFRPGIIFVGRVVFLFMISVTAVQRIIYRMFGSKSNSDKRAEKRGLIAVLRQNKF